MAKEQCLRSLFDTLVAAISTIALFVASNWRLAGVIGDMQNQRMSQQVFIHTHVAFAVPLVALYLSVYNALQVWAVKRRIHQLEDRERYPDHDSIAIITLCPIYIQFPVAAIQPERLTAVMRQNWYREVEMQMQEEVCPLELRAISAHAAPLHTNDELNEQVRAGDGVAVVDEGGGQIRAGDNVADHDEGPMLCIQLPDTSPLSNGQHAPDRLALLRLGLVPLSKQLSFLPSRNRFQSVITAIQAIGYTLTVLQRAIEHLGISPMEAIVTFLSIIVIIQIAIELYASGIYQRPMLLSLNTQQFEQFLEERRRAVINEGGGQGDPNPYFWQTRNVFKLMVFLSWVLASSPAVYATYQYWEKGMTGCAMAALTFFIAQTLLASLLGLIACGGLNVDNASFPMVFISALAYACSVLLAIGYTINYWHHFNQQTPVTGNVLSWILRFLPFLSS